MKKPRINLSELDFQDAIHIKDSDCLTYDDARKTLAHIRQKLEASIVIDEVRPERGARWLAVYSAALVAKLSEVGDSDSKLSAAIDHAESIANWEAEIMDNPAWRTEDRQAREDQEP